MHGDSMHAWEHPGPASPKQVSPPGRGPADHRARARTFLDGLPRRCPAPPQTRTHTRTHTSLILTPHDPSGSCCPLPYSSASSLTLTVAAMDMRMHGVRKVGLGRAGSRAGGRSAGPGEIYAGAAGWRSTHARTHTHTHTHTQAPSGMTQPERHRGSGGDAERRGGAAARRRRLRRGGGGGLVRAQNEVRGGV
jgi:hypothetical protein